MKENRETNQIKGYENPSQVIEAIKLKLKDPTLKELITPSEDEIYDFYSMERKWRLMENKRAIEILSNPEELKKMMRYVWFTRIRDCLNMDMKDPIQRGAQNWTRYEIDHIVSELERGWPSYSSCINPNIYRFVYSQGNLEALELFSEIDGILDDKMSETKNNPNAEGFALKIVSEKNISPNKLLEIFELCSRDYHKTVTAIASLGLNFITIEEINEELDFDELDNKIIDLFPGYNPDLYK